jgi:hypothetical protein
MMLRAILLPEALLQGIVIRMAPGVALRRDAGGTAPSAHLVRENCNEEDDQRQFQVVKMPFSAHQNLGCISLCSRRFDARSI